MPPVHNNNNVKTMPAGGVTGAVFEFYCDTNERIQKKKNNGGSGCRSAAHDTADSDGTGWDGRRKECQLCDENATTQHG